MHETSIVDASGPAIDILGGDLDFELDSVSSDGTATHGVRLIAVTIRSDERKPGVAQGCWYSSWFCATLHVTEDSMSISTRERVREHRRRLREQGLRPIQIWVPDVRSPKFREQAHRQSLAVAESPHAQEDQAFIDAASEWSDEAR